MGRFVVCTARAVTCTRWQLRASRMPLWLTLSRIAPKMAPKWTIQAATAYEVHATAYEVHATEVGHAGLPPHVFVRLYSAMFGPSPEMCWY